MAGVATAVSAQHVNAAINLVQDIHMSPPD